MNRTGLSIRQQLVSMADDHYKIFSCKLIPNIPPEQILGVRLPDLRKFAQRIAGEDPESFFADAGDETFEEKMLQGMVICYLDGSFNEKLVLVEKFIYKIDNWSVCDSFCAGLKLPLKYPGEMWDFITPYLQDQREYFIRFGSVMLLSYYVDETHLHAALSLLDQVRSRGYYARTGVAWAISEYFSHFPEETMRYLHESSLDDQTFNKVLQKIIESRFTDAKTREEIHALQR